ncbi:uncharacterized protein LOC134223039 [Armigeres subalbatus]|uniref:uncharacterized protein LOC134223039 n=1 Tax=Armigeres subalbatus TaxID=124917 RepID=UPI002ED60E88
MLKLALLIAILSCAYAGNVETVHSYSAPIGAHHSPATALSYTTVTHHVSPALTQGYPHSVPVLAAPTHGYAAPLNNHHVYGHNFAPAHSYEQGYAQYVAHNNYGYHSHGAPVAAKAVVVAQAPLYQHNAYASHAVAAPVLVAANGYNNVNGGVHHLGYNNHQGHHAY